MEQPTGFNVRIETSRGGNQQRVGALDPPPPMVREEVFWLDRQRNGYPLVSL